MTELLRVTVERDGVTLSCLTGGGRRQEAAAGGDGPPVVLLHGLAGSAAELGGVARALLPGHRVIAVDQREHAPPGRCGPPCVRR